MYNVCYNFEVYCIQLCLLMYHGKLATGFPVRGKVTQSNLVQK